MIRATAIFLLSSVCLPAWATLTTVIDRNRIALDDTVRLDIRSDQQAKSRPDFSALSQDFTIVSSSSSSQYQLVNGQMSAMTKWSVILQPKREGQLQIPALTLDGSSTQPIALTVTAAKAPGSPDALDSQDLFIETQLSKADPYVQEMVLYTVRIFHAVKILEGQLPDPSLDDAMVRQLEPDRQYNLQRNGRRYNVIERRYVLYPLKSGALQVPAPELNAKVPAERNAQTGSSGNDPFSMDSFFSQTPFGALLGNTRALTVRGNPQTLTTRALPPGHSGQWLPATALSFYESYEMPSSGLKVGEPISRKITIRADGQTGEMVPEATIPTDDRYRIYPNKAESLTHDLESGVAGQKTQQFTFIPTMEGELTLPELRYHWWDVRTNRQQEAVLPARKVMIGAANPTSLPAETAAQPVTPEQPAAAEAPAANLTSSAESSTGFWPWLVALLALVVVAMLGWVYLLSRRLRAMKASKPVVTEPVLNGAEARRQFRSACKQNNAEAARKALIHWARQEWPDSPPNGLLGIAKHFRSEAARNAIRDLELVLFADGGKTWDGATLADAVPHLPNRPKAKIKADKNLPELYT